MKLFLIGLMGSGKTYWAEKLKKKYKVPTYDLDNLVEIMEERTIAEIFKEDGEEFFRKEEAKMLRLFKEKKQFILSCGGGTPCFNNNMEWMNKQGITIWLDEPVEVLAERLEKEKDHRPLIKELKEGELIPFLSKMSDDRNSFYKQATYRLKAEQLNDKKASTKYLRNMHKSFLRASALLGALAVALGAFGAHALRGKVSDLAVSTFETGVRYQFYHVLALTMLAILYSEFKNKWVQWAGNLFMVGILLFSGSLYVLTFVLAAVRPGYNWIGIITPFGGLAFIAGWFCMLMGVAGSAKK